MSSEVPLTAFNKCLYHIQKHLLRGLIVVDYKPLLFWDQPKEPIDSVAVIAAIVTRETRHTLVKRNGAMRVSISEYDTVMVLQLVVSFNSLKIPSSDFV